MTDNHYEPGEFRRRMEHFWPFVQRQAGVSRQSRLAHWRQVSLSLPTALGCSLRQKEFPMRVAREAWVLGKESILGFINDNALSHGAAMAFYAVTSLAPILLIVVAIAGLVFGHEAAQLALSAEIAGVMGSQTGDLLRSTIESASHRTAGTVATLVGIVTFFVTASGVFGEMQLSLNTIWKIDPPPMSVSRLVRARAASLGLVAALGFLLLVSLAASAAISALGAVINAHLPFGTIILASINGVVSFVLISALFAAIFKILPDRSLAWRDVAIGAAVTALLFTIGKSLIGWYIGTSAIASSYGAAGALLVVLLWVYYSSEIFLLGAEFTRAYSVRLGSRSDLQPIVEAESPSRQTSNPGPTIQREVQAWIVITGLLTFVATRVWPSRRS
ncbi:ribonuclease BN [Mesorhizobium sp. LSJC265A00]|uniref:YihY/virulence factor BrkB family protein n=1 Tax=Mesorhizobium sp. LSJC265A00 TaxID=1287322 RepID=UPI0003CE050C|nr:ribonuclease BN [Mesorhizobium sp. LSJC265A00]